MSINNHAAVRFGAVYRISPNRKPDEIDLNHVAENLSETGRVDYFKRSGTYYITTDRDATASENATRILNDPENHPAEHVSDARGVLAELTRSVSGMLRVN